LFESMIMVWNCL